MNFLIDAQLPRRAADWFADFVDSHLLRGRPAKLLLVSTGNISNRDLECQAHAFLELGRAGLVVRG